MNLLHLIPYYAPAWTYGGSVRAATDLTRALVAAGHRVTVLTTDTLSATARIETLRETVNGVEVVRVRNRSNWLRGRLNLSTPRGIAATVERLIRERAIDVIHCHELRTVENLRVAPVANRLSVPVVVSPHGTLPHGTGRSIVKQVWDRALGGRMLPRLGSVIALTENEATDARAIWSACGTVLPDDQIHIVPNGVPLDDFADLPPAESFRVQWKLGTGPVVLFLGLLHERKGLQLLIPAFAQVVETVPDARLLIVGPDEGMRNTLEAQVAQHQLAGCVIFTGMLTGADKLAALAAADLFVLPAVGEGFSMAVLEAMACGLPVLLTPGCNFPEVADAGAGVVVEREITPLAGALRNLLADSANLAAMGRTARTMIEARYTWAQVAQQMETVYHAVIACKD
ncbi:MAG: glycosyltransferase [Anaerolineae bacterium]|nr:glycosyltransferase [Anaerolineae bacterium]